MALEIERKFLVEHARLPPLPAPDELQQGYLAKDPAVRIRLRTLPSGERKAAITVKGRGLVERHEFEYEIPTGDAVQLLVLCATALKKQRYTLGRWEVDFFPDRDLWLAEIELARADEPFERPDWLGAEVSGDERYQNVNLATAVHR
jgi:adenylate cyclase